MISVKCYPVGLLLTNCYLIKDEVSGECALVDPGGMNFELNAELRGLEKGKFKYILLTHGHFDHIGECSKLQKAYGAKVVISKEDKCFLNDDSLNLWSMMTTAKSEAVSADIVVSDGDKLKLGDTEFRFMSTPGHTIGSGCYIFADDKVIFSGDTLFRTSMGRTDFPTGDETLMMDSLAKLRNLRGNYVVYPGHNAKTELEYERNNNPYM